VNFAKKLRDVVASNFIEIARTDEDADRSRVSAPEEYLPAQPAPSAPPEPPVTAEPAPAVRPVADSAPHADWTGQDLTEFVGADGTVDFNRVLSSANLPHLGFTAEQVAKVLAALPNDLPMQVKRLTLKATLEAVDRNTVIDPQDVVADAMLKKMHVAQYRDSLRAHVEMLRQDNAAKIVGLQTEIDRLKAASESAEQKRRVAETACDEQMALMEQVVVFFQSETAQNLSAAGSTSDEDEEELPPFMRDDAVFRMLGLDPAPDDAEAEDGKEAVPAAGKAQKRTGRFAVADNIEA
jgi:hypothetical protein